MRPDCQSAEAIQHCIETFHPNSGEVFELRAFGRRKKIYSGFFDDKVRATEEALKLDKRRDIQGIFLTPNNVNPDLLARRANRIDEAESGSATADADVTRLQWLPFDLDPIRATHISSTDGEHNLAIERAASIRAGLAQLGWPAPILADSGNGAWLFYRVDLPNDKESHLLVEECIRAAGALFSDNRLTVDKSAANAARVVPVFGTVKRKGDDVEDRPHRRSAILQAPDRFMIVPREALEALPRLVPESTRSVPDSSSASRFDIEAFMERHGIAVLNSASWDGTGVKYSLRVCPFNDAHTGGSAAVLKFANGAVAFKCHHNGCAGRTWHELRERYDPRPHKGLAPADLPERLKREVRLRLIDAADVAVVRTEWDEPHRIPHGKFVLFEGDGDLGKTTFAMGWLAAGTRGEHFFPVDEADEVLYPPRVRRILVVAREDDYGVLKARLVAAGFVSERLKFIDGRYLIDNEGNIEKDASFLLPRDIEPLKRAISDSNADIVYIDALLSHIRIDGDSKSPQDVRQGYADVIALINGAGVTLVATRHWGKGNGRAIDRGLGSSEIGHIARATLTFAKHPELEGRFVVAQTKKNLSKAMPAVSYRLEILDSVDDHGNPWTVTKAVIDGIAEGVTADDLAMAAPLDRETRTEREGAKQAILAMFSTPDIVTAELLHAENTAWSERTWERARADLTRAKILKRGGGGKGGPVTYEIDRSKLALFATKSHCSPPSESGEEQEQMANNGRPVVNNDREGPRDSTVRSPDNAELTFARARQVGLIGDDSAPPAQTSLDL